MTNPSHCRIVTGLDDPAVRQMLVAMLRGERLPPSGAISQPTLHAYDLASMIKRAHGRMREQLLAAYDSGAEIERGARRLHITEYESYRFTQAGLVRVLGEEMVQQIRSQLTPTRTRQVRVIAVPGDLPL